MSARKSLFNIPINTQLLKIGSFYINLNDSINRNENIRQITEYIFSDVYNVVLDIICIQGLNDTKITKLLIKNIVDISNKYKKPVHIVPKTDMVAVDSVDDAFQYQWNSSTNIDTSDIYNIIISKYPIITTSTINLNNTSDAKLVGNNKIILANVNVNGYIISIYNVTLSQDYMGIPNTELRNKEVKLITNLIKKNSDQIKKYNKNTGDRLIIKDVHLLCGQFNVTEIKSNKLNLELVQVLKTLKAIDIFRFYCLINKNDDNGFTCSHNTRDCFISMILINHKIGIDVESPKVLLDNAYKEHGIGIVLSYVVKSVKINEYHPIEVIFLLNKKEKEHIEE
jgi:hypothetical protein